MQRRGAVLRPRRHRKSAAQHGANGRKIIVAGGVGNLTQCPFRRTRHQLRMCREDRVGACIIAAPERVQQSIEWTRLPEQPVENLDVAALARDVESRDVEAKRPLVDVPAVLSGIDHRKPVLIDSHGNRRWIGVQMSLR